MYPTPEFTPAVAAAKLFSSLRHIVTDIFHNTVEIIGGAIVVGIVIGIGAIAVIAIWYAWLSIEGHQMEQPGPEVE